MSSVAFHSGNKTENTVYLAFGVVVSLALIRYTLPQAFDNLDVNFTPLLGVVAFWAPIVGSLLFFLKIDRILTFSLKKYCDSKYGTDIQSNILIYEFSNYHWLYGMSSDWETPEEKYKIALNRLVEGTDVHEDIWALKGWFYFLLSLPILTYAFGITQWESISILAIVELVVFGIAFYNYRGFIKRSSYIALFRTLTEVKSIIQTRVSGTSTEPTSVNSEILATIMDELNSMIEKRDWLGFERRFYALLEDFGKISDLKSSWFVKYYVETWARCFSTRAGGEPELWLSRTKVFRTIVNHSIAKELVTTDSILTTLLEVEDKKLDDETTFFEIIDKIGIENASIEYVFQAIYRLTERAEKVTNEKSVKIVLKWYKEGTRRFEELLLLLAEVVSDKLAKEIISVLVSDFENEQVWTKIKPKSVNHLIVFPKYPERKAVALRLALRNSDDTIKESILHSSTSDDLEFVKEALVYLSDKDPSLETSAQAFFLQKYDNDQNSTDEIIAILRDSLDSNIRKNLVKLANCLLEHRSLSSVGERIFRDYLQDPNPTVRKEVLLFLVERQYGLKLYTPNQSFLEAIRETDLDPDNRRLAIILLNRLESNEISFTEK